MESFGLTDVKTLPLTKGLPRQILLPSLGMNFVSTFRFLQSIIILLSLDPSSGIAAVARAVQVPTKQLSADLTGYCHCMHFSRRKGSKIYTVHILLFEIYAEFLTRQLDLSFRPRYVCGGRGHLSLSPRQQERGVTEVVSDFFWRHRKMMSFEGHLLCFFIKGKSYRVSCSDGII